MQTPPSSPASADQLAIVGQLADWRWRLNNLYWITDEEGHRIPFRLNWAQESLFDNMHFCNLILKARQLGFTTFIQIFMLDLCVFKPNIRAGTIAHTLSDAQAIFRDKIKYPYDNLPDQIRARVALERDSANELALTNNSSLRVSTSYRSGTLQYLHVSEYGKMCAKYPEKAREVRTGALNTVQAGQVVFIESTAEGQEGHFFDMCSAAQSQQRIGEQLTPLDFRFHFFPWWKAPKYRLAPEGVPIPHEATRYFDQLATQGITLDPAQKAWYVKKAATQLGDMKREYPATPKEAFEASVEGAYYGTLMEAAEAQGRIGHYPALPEYPVHSAWDIGRRDYNPIWFWQRLPGRTRVVGFIKSEGEAMPYYAREMKKLYAEKGWSRQRAVDFVPHDARVTEWGSNKTRIEQMFAQGLNPSVPPELSLEDGINAVRMLLPNCEFDLEGCAEGIKGMKAYRKEWDDARGAWKDSPFKNWAAHDADALRTLACAQCDLILPLPPKEPEKPRGVESITVNELLRLEKANLRRRTIV